MNTGSFAVDISKHRGDRATRREDVVAVEEPLEIRLGYSTPDGRASRSISITMRTPGDDEALAAGFLATESIIRNADDIASIDVCGPPAPDSGNHNVIRVELKAGVEVDLGRLQRHFYTTSSCGVCGKTSLDALKVVGQQPMRGGKPAFSKAMLVALPERLRAAQRTFDETGGLHAAAAFDHDGSFVAV
ncbi:MAG: formate dehydrogenase accessory sulfurtransferase FdhD, partial [Woeseiaceae bacterium]|nr:formate dehydrogenase accessory sulfurtransferase FdhD [Woeseiaceae bacterium]